MSNIFSREPSRTICQERCLGLWLRLCASQIFCNRADILRSWLLRSVRDFSFNATFFEKYVNSTSRGLALCDRTFREFLLEEDEDLITLRSLVLRKLRRDACLRYFVPQGSRLPMESLADWPLCKRLWLREMENRVAEGSTDVLSLFHRMLDCDIFVSVIPLVVE